MSPVFTILQLNTFASNAGFHRSQQRYVRQIEEVKQLAPTFICLQECYSVKLQKQYRDALLPLGYQCISCTYGCPDQTCKKLLKQNNTWLVHYGPHIILTLLFLLFFGYYLGSYLWTILSLIIVVAVSPPWLPHILFRFSPTPYDLLHGDVLGLMIFGLCTMDLESVRPHRFFVEAHEWPLTITRRPYDILERWFSHTFVNKGMLSVVCTLGNTRFLIATGHFTTGVVNTERHEQLQEFRAIVLEEAKRNKCDAILCGLDTNAHSLLPEMVWFTDPHQGGFVDAMESVHGDDSHHHFTWDARNVLTKGNLLEPDQRLDYLLLKSLGKLQLKWQEARNVFDQPYVSDHLGVLGEVVAR